MVFVVGPLDPDIGEAVHVELRFRIEFFISRHGVGIGANDARQYHRDIVSPTVLVGGVHEYSACRSELGSVVTQNLGQGDIVDHVRKPVGAEKIQIVSLGGDFFYVHFHGGLRPDGARDDVAMDLLLDLLGGVDALVDELLAQGVIDGQTLKHVAA